MFGTRSMFPFLLRGMILVRNNQLPVTPEDSAQ